MQETEEKKEEKKIKIKQHKNEGMRNEKKGKLPGHSSSWQALAARHPPPPFHAARSQKLPGTKKNNKAITK